MAACDDFTRPVAPKGSPPSVPSAMTSGSSVARVPGAFSIVLGSPPINAQTVVPFPAETLLYEVRASAGAVVDRRCSQDTPPLCWPEPRIFDAGGWYSVGWNTYYGNISVSATAGHYNFRRPTDNPEPKEYVMHWVFGGPGVATRGNRGSLQVWYKRYRGLRLQYERFAHD